MDTGDLAGRIAVVTGAGSGLGAAMARTFAEVGMAVAALDIDEAAAQATATSLADEFGVPTTAVHTDVGDADSVVAACAELKATHEKAAALSYDAGDGSSKDGSPEDNSPEPPSAPSSPCA